MVARWSTVMAIGDPQPRAPEEFEELVRAHRKLIFSVVFGIVHNRQAAEDLTQEALLRAFKAWPGFRGECQPKAWLARVATNVAMNHAMRNRESPDVIADLPDTLDLSRHVERMAMSTALRVAVDHLSPMLREPLMMFEYENIGCLEIGSRLGISPGAVRVRLLRARRQLAHEMEAWA